MRKAAVAAVLLCVLAAGAVWWCFGRGYILYYGDAQCHLDLSRSILDSRTPGYDQLGTVWLPVLHVICLPFVANDWLWSTGLAGALPVAFCFVVAGLCFYLAANEAYGSSLAAAVMLACFALNPNVLYLASIPMTEVVFFAGLGVMLLAMFRFRRSQRKRWIVLGVLASWSMSLTRYDGWFLIPFAAVFFAAFAHAKRWIVLIVFGGLGSLAPLYWLAHNWWETANVLDFYNGPYSAIAIQGAKSYPGYHDWAVAAGYYAKAGQLCAGWCLVMLGIVGVVCAIKKRVVAPCLFLVLTPCFYIWSIHSSGTPIFLPQLHSQGYYNSRYGIAVVVLAAFAAGAIVLAMPARWKKFAFVLPLFSLAPWIVKPSPENWICWKESQVNSVGRRAWTRAAAEFLRVHYHSGQGILTPSASGDITGVFCRAHIPLRETLDIGNGPEWWANTLRPDLVHQELWAVVQSGDRVAREIRRGDYEITREIQTPGAPALEIWHRGVGNREK